MLIIVSQKLPPTYIGVGHNYRWNEETGEYEELYRSRNSGHIVLWYYTSDREIVETNEKTHWDFGSHLAKGRIDIESKQGSISFGTGKIENQKQILNDLISKYPGILFGIYDIGGPYTIQQYWEKFLNQGKTF